MRYGKGESQPGRLEELHLGRSSVSEARASIRWNPVVLNIADAQVLTRVGSFDVVCV